VIFVILIALGKLGEEVEREITAPIARHLIAQLAVEKDPIIGFSCAFTFVIDNPEEQFQFVVPGQAVFLVIGFSRNDTSKSYRVDTTTLPVPAKSCLIEIQPGTELSGPGSIYRNLPCFRIDVLCHDWIQRAADNKSSK